MIGDDKWRMINGCKWRMIKKKDGNSQRERGEVPNDVDDDSPTTVQII